MISEFLFYEAESSKDEKSNYVNLKIEIRQLIKDDFNRRILSEVLLDLRKDVAGDTQKRLFKLYQDLNLHNDAFAKLKSFRWQLVSKAILDLTQMQVSEAYSFVSKFINDKRSTIRRQAEIAVVTLKPEGINYFLDTTKYKISEWQQLKLLDTLRMEEDFQPPRFKAWLTSTNRHVVLFALRLIKYYNQNDAEEAIIELVKHKNSQIKEEAIACIKEFHFTEALETLKLVFWNSSTDVKISILDAVGLLGSNIDIEFLKKIENKENNFAVKSKAHSSINAISPDSIMPSKGLMKTSSYQIPDDIKTEQSELEEIHSHRDSIDQNSNEIEASEIAIALEEETHSLKESQEPKIKKSAKNTSKKTDQYSLDFLPIVVLEVTGNTSLDSNLVDPNKIEVNKFDDNKSFKQENQTSKNTISSVEIREEELAFLPVVTDTTQEIIEEKITAHQSDIEISIHDIEVYFEEVTDSPCKTLEKSDLNPLSAEVKTLKEDTSDVISNTTKQTIESHKSMELEDEQKFKKIINDLVNFHNHKKSEGFEESALLEFGNEYIEARNEKGEANEEIETSKPELEIENGDKEIINADTISIPKAILTDEIFEYVTPHKENIEESCMQLLDDISEMGDQRELPLLEELLINEKYRTVNGRIKKLIETFSKIEEKISQNIQFRSLNVFEDLFRTCDTEAKLILMNEIVAVGDESEIEFLEGIIEKEEGIIKQKAREILLELNTKLSQNKIETDSTEAKEYIEPLIEEKTLLQFDSLMKELEIKPPITDNGIFDVSFEITKPQKEVFEKSDIKAEGQTSLLSQIYSFSNKIIDKFNG